MHLSRMIDLEIALMSSGSHAFKQVLLSLSKLVRMLDLVTSRHSHGLLYGTNLR